MIIYFSATGNSKYVAKRFAEALDDEIIDAGVWIKKRKAGHFRSEKPWVFVAPTYAWRMPRLVERFLLASTFDGSTEAYFVLTSGDGSGGAGFKCHQLAEKLIFNYCGLLQVVMPENYIMMFSAPEQEKALAIIDKAEAVIDEGIALVKQGKTFDLTYGGIKGAILSGAINIVFYKFAIKADPFYATDACTSCGICEKLCPMNNIALSSYGKPVWGKECTHCSACLNHCPVGAIEYGKKTAGKTRYTCPK